MIHCSFPLHCDTIAPVETTGAALDARKHRRLGWTGGPTVPLADGCRWSLPDISFLSIATPSGLQADIVESFRLAGVLKGISDRFRLHGQMANVCLRRLRTNDGLPAEEWKALLKFDGLGAMLSLIHDTSFAVAVARPV